MHVRQSIRAAVAAELIGLASTGSNVFKARTFPLAAERLPGLCVYSNSESAETESIGASPKLQREVSIVVEGFARAGADLDDALDSMSAEVEEALGIAGPVGGSVAMTGPVSTEIEFADPGAEVAVAVVRMDFRYLYITAQGAPEVAV